MQAIQPTEEMSRNVDSVSERARSSRKVDHRCEAALRLPCLKICREDAESGGSHATGDILRQANVTHWS